MQQSDRIFAVQVHVKACASRVNNALGNIFKLRETPINCNVLSSSRYTVMAVGKPSWYSKNHYTKDNPQARVTIDRFDFVTKLQRLDGNGRLKKFLKTILVS